MGLKGDDIAKHNSADSCWVIVHVSYHRRALLDHQRTLD